ncbi:MAG: aminoacetone oxidase family FAD-binding enzyme [Parcubacteria group bacterium]|nr:aminoacetone oxidase family FAD-binding enzyme [Parcubacteria group bacterium]
MKGEKAATHVDVLVIGGGAAGMMAAGHAAESGKKILLLERNKRLGEKLRISGGSRCNITNAEDDSKKLLAFYGDAEQFLYSSFAEFGVKETFQFFESRGLPLKVEALKRVFPKSEKAADVVKVLEQYMKEVGVVVRTGAGVKEVQAKDGKIETVVTTAGEFSADSYILATGGLSHPETGSTGDGFTWLKALGHTVVPPTPTIVPLKVKEKWVKELSGKSMKDVKVNFLVEGKKKFSRTGSVLFTHFGVSGPTILNSAGMVSDLMHEGQVTITIDTAPTLDLGILDRRITEVFDQNKNKLLKNVFKELAPAGTSDTLLSLLPDIDPELKVHSVTKDKRRALAELLKAIPLTVTGLMDFDRAVLADGGVPLTEVDMRTMRSKKIENLFITGDLLHIRRPSGGYSLQLCWTTGYVAGGNA